MKSFRANLFASQLSCCYFKFRREERRDHVLSSGIVSNLATINELCERKIQRHREEGDESYRHIFTPPLPSGKSFFHFILHLSERRKNFKIVPWIRSTQQENEINQQQSAESPPEGMKLKALHHSILVKAEFFMKQRRIRVRKGSFLSLVCFLCNLCFVICKERRQRRSSLSERKRRFNGWSRKRREGGEGLWNDKCEKENLSRRMILTDSSNTKQQNCVAL